MNEIEKADKIRGFKALCVLFGVPFVLAVLWQVSDASFLRFALITISVAVAGWGFSKYHKRRTLPKVTASPTVAPARSSSLLERSVEIITAHKNRIQLSGHYEVQNLVRDCLSAIAQQEGRTDLAPHGEYLYKWKRRPNLPEEYGELAERLETDFVRREDELKKLQEAQQEAQITVKAENMLVKNWDLVEKFLEITERKVSVLDDYGDEQWVVVPDEVVKFLKKISEREGLPIDWDSIKKPKGKHWEISISWDLPKECRWMVTRLPELFREYHARAKSKVGEEIDFQSLTGVEFETFVARRLRSAGYEVRGTPSTGDQGADLIAKKDGRTVIIQAKRYQGTVGNKAVQEVISAVRFYGGDEGWVVTNSTFTASAVALAQKANVKLVDGIALRKKLLI